MTHSLKSHQVEMPDFTAVRGVYIINILNLTEFPQEIQLCSLDRFSPGGVCGLGTKIKEVLDIESECMLCEQTSHSPTNLLGKVALDREKALHQT